MKDNVKSSQVVVRFTPNDEKTIEELADEVGLTKAGWIRQMVLERIREARRTR